MRIGDLDALKHKFAQIAYIRFTADMGQGGWEMFSEKEIEKIIDSAPELGYEDGIISVETATRRSIELEEAYNNGWSDGFSEGESERTDEIGKWIFHKDYHENCRYGCNQCGNLNNIPSNFCPNCGAKMKRQLP